MVAAGASTSTARNSVTSGSGRWRSQANDCERSTAVEPHTARNDGQAIEGMEPVWRTGPRYVYGSTRRSEEAPMLSWLAKRMIARNMRTVSAGDTGPTLKMDAGDVRFRFPGNNSWATDLEGREKLADGSTASPRSASRSSRDEVVLKGFPWKQTICVRGRSTSTPPRASGSTRTAT